MCKNHSHLCIGLLTLLADGWHVLGALTVQLPSLAGVKTEAGFYDAVAYKNGQIWPYNFRRYGLA